MNQILYMNLEIEVNGYHFRLSLPIGAPWQDALNAIKQMGEHAYEIAKKTAEAAEVPLKKEISGTSNEQVTNGTTE